MLFIRNAVRYIRSSSSYERVFRVGFVLIFFLLFGCGKPAPVVDTLSLAPKTPTGPTETPPPTLTVTAALGPPFPLYQSTRHREGITRVFLKYSVPTKLSPVVSDSLLEQLDLINFLENFEIVSPRLESCGLSHVAMSFTKGALLDVYLQADDLPGKTACDEFFKKILLNGIEIRYRNVAVRNHATQVGQVGLVTLILK